MHENRTPFLSLDKAISTGPGDVCDLGTVLATHSVSAWVTGYERPTAGYSVTVALEVSHDDIHWVHLGHKPLIYEDGRAEGVFGTWPARYVRAAIVGWPEQVTAGQVSATVASV